MTIHIYGEFLSFVEKCRVCPSRQRGSDRLWKGIGPIMSLLDVELSAHWHG